MPFLARLIGLFPLGIGATVLLFLWTEQGWGAPPLFFRVFGSFVAGFFVLIGLIFLTGKKSADFAEVQRLASRTGTGPVPGPPSAGDRCPNCQAPLTADLAVSPHGDVRCGHCNQWYNVHGR
ncbi:MAG: hypothetical protein R3E96_01835 [Planctomycetota bacterium]